MDTSLQTHSNPKHHNHYNHAQDHHHYGSLTQKKALFFIATLVIGLFILTELIISSKISSSVLMADAFHNLVDLLSLLAVFFAAVINQKKNTARKTYGYGKLTVFTALINSAVIFTSMGVVLANAIPALISPHFVNQYWVILTAATGTILNGFIAFFLHDHKGELNSRAVFIHMLGDMALSFGIIVAGFLILYTGYMRIDPALSILIALFIDWSSFGVLRNSLTMSMDFVPPQTDIFAVRKYLLSLEGVIELHDLHVWSLSTEKTALTVHLVMKSADQAVKSYFLHNVAEELATKFHIDHATIQPEDEKIQEICQAKNYCGDIFKQQSEKQAL